MQAADLTCEAASRLLALASSSPPESSTFRNIEISFANQIIWGIVCPSKSNYLGDFTKVQLTFGFELL